METKVLSVRVPVQFANDLQSYCKRSNTTVSEYMQKGFTTVGMTQLDEISIPNDTQNTLLGLTGGSAIGILAYKGVKGALGNKYTEEQVEVYSTLAGICAGIISMVGIVKLMELSK